MSGDVKPKNLFADVLERVRAAAMPLLAPGTDFSRVLVEPPRDAAHGDMATNVAMVLAKDARRKPRELADLFADKLRADDLIAKVEVAGPGFINMSLKPAAWIDKLRAAVKLGGDFGRSDTGQGVPVN